MQKTDRKAALAAYKEQKVPSGIYAVRCAPTGEAWVGAAPNLGTIQNRIWFTLRQNGSPFPSLQAAWNAHGADAFSFSELERFAEAAPQGAALKNRVAHWLAELGATQI